MPPCMLVRDLLRKSHEQLEQMYEQSREIAVPRGIFRGRTLHCVRAHSATHRGVQLAMLAPFRLQRFGIDFDRRCWYFFRPALGIGRFSAAVGPSRWRDTSVVRLDYHVSRLPESIRSWLYDEVKPLSDQVCLGIGGVNAGRGVGDLFFFALERVA